MKKGGASMQEIAFITDHHNYQSLESYLSAPDHEDYECYNDMMAAYASNKSIEKTNKTQEMTEPKSVKK